MVRSAAISWSFSLVVAALTLPIGQLQALADDGLSEKLETPPPSLEPKTVRVILLPPASDDVFASKRPALLNEAPIIMVQPARNSTIAQPLSEPAEAREDTIAAERPTAAKQPLGAEIRKSTTVEKRPSAPKQPSRVALLPPASDVAIASPPPVPEKTQESATLSVPPSLPERSPYRQSPFKSEIVENELILESGPEEAAAVRRQASEPAPSKGNAVSRFLAKLWPGGDKESTLVASNDEAASPVPPTASASTLIEPAEGSAKSEKPPLKRFLDGIQFWKK